MAYSHNKRSLMYFLGPLIALIWLLGIGLLAALPERTSAQTVSTPITRHVVLYWAKRYTTYQWNWGGQPRVAIPYAWGYADWINDALGPGAANCFLPNFASLFQTRLNNNCYTGCNSNAGADCSGYVMRVWGRPVNEAKWDTAAIAAHSTVVPCRATDNQCLQRAVRNEDLPKRMRMGDVFDDWFNPDRHVVLLYYFDPETAPAQPRFYEENIVNPPCAARLNEGGWAWLEANGGWWDGTNGYRPYRYNEIRDDLYLPWLAHAWYGWESTLFARNNDTTPKTYVLQHTLYGGGGGDAGALNTGTYRRANPFANDLWELPTSILNPGNFYRGGGVVAADTGTSAVVLVQGNGQGLAYSGIFPFDSLGQAAAQTLYLPVFLYTLNGDGLLSKVLVQNAGSDAANLTLTYYGDDGRTCTQTLNNLQPWGTAILEVNGCNWGGTPPTSGAIRLNATRPVAALTLEHIYWNRVGGYNAFSQGAKTLYVPELTRNGWGIGWFSTLHLMNVGSSSATITIRYYTYGGQYFCTDTRALSPNRHTAIDYRDTRTCVAGYNYDLFSAVITSGQPLVAAVNQDNATYGDFQAYNAAIAGKTALVLPLIRKGNYAGEVWAASCSVQNTVASNNQVTLTFYDQAGNSVTSVARTLPPYGSYLFYTEIPNNFSGSVVIGAQHGVVAIGSLFNTALGGDGAMRYNAVEKKGLSALGTAEEETGGE